MARPTSLSAFHRCEFGDYVESRRVLTTGETLLQPKTHRTRGSSSSSIFRMKHRLVATPSMRTCRATGRTMWGFIRLRARNRTYSPKCLFCAGDELADELCGYRRGILYPRGATLGGSSQVNAMNFAWAPDNEWDYIANLTGDASWGHEHMRRHLMDLENCTYVPQGTPGHGFDGYLTVSLRILLGTGSECI